MNEHSSTFQYASPSPRLVSNAAPVHNRLGEYFDQAWTGKSVDTAQWQVSTLFDGRIHAWIRHEIVRGVTPEMLVWWFKHLEGDMAWNGRRVSRYRVWHPQDHVSIRYAKRVVDERDGQIGPGTMLHIRENFGGNPRYAINALSEITRLDRGGYEHRPRRNGIPIGRMEYTFAEDPNGTLYQNSITVGFTGWIGRLVNPLIRWFVFDGARARAWVKHNVEEVGNFENFLPELFRQESGAVGESENA
jgi:hypothetical protein